MKIYTCSSCSNPVYFDNDICLQCQSWLGYRNSDDRLLALAPGQTEWTLEGHAYRYCANHQPAGCNWLVSADDATGLCTACDLNRTIPNLNESQNIKAWRALEKAKRRLVYALQRLDLPLDNRRRDPEGGLAFDFLDPDAATEPVQTGHDRGLITLNLDEANPAVREATRLQMRERYRTLIGHFRHEIGHYYWDRLVAPDPDTLTAFRALFGDERTDYAAALEQHYAAGPSADWQLRYISAYATAHPWEDWAETWAHYLHLLDMLEAAYAFGISVDPPVSDDDTLGMQADFDPYLESDLERILAACLPLTFAVNTLNRGMGHPDLYPFVLNEGVREKLGFVHRVVRRTSER